MVDISNKQAVYDYLKGLLERDTEIILANDHTPIAKLIPIDAVDVPKADRIPDLYPSLWVSDDFDDLLPGEYWLTDQL